MCVGRCVCPGAIRTVTLKLTAVQVFEYVLHVTSDQPCEEGAKILLFHRAEN